MITISTQIAVINGLVQFDESDDTTLGDWTARVSRTKTLDGGVWINNSGAVDGDRTFTIKALLTKAQADGLEYIFRNYQTVNLSCSQGFFSGSIYTLGINNGELNMQFYVKEKL